MGMARRVRVEVVDEGGAVVLDWEREASERWEREASGEGEAAWVAVEHSTSVANGARWKE